MYLALKYALFAVLATGANIAVQDISLRIYGGKFGILLSIGWGTIAGLVVKYILDKKYIFCCVTRTLLEDGQKFILYSLMGIITTAIFWTTEMAFHYLFGTKSLRYTGAVLGLALGYFIKYRLDKRFVFTSSQ